MKLIDQKNRESEKKGEKLRKHEPWRHLILMMFDNLIWRLDGAFNTRFAVNKNNLVIQGHH